MNRLATTHRSGWVGMGMLSTHHTQKRKAPRASRGFDYATYRGHISSHYGDACRRVFTGFGVELSEVSSIDFLSIDDSIPHSGASHPFRLAESRRSSNALSRMVATHSLQAHPQHGARTTAEHLLSNQIISSWFENPSRAESPGTISVDSFRRTLSSRKMQQSHVAPPNGAHAGFRGIPIVQLSVPHSASRPSRWPLECVDLAGCVVLIP